MAEPLPPPETMARPLSETELAVGAAHKLGADAASRALMFALVYYAQIRLTPADYGQFAWATGVGFVLAQITDLGMALVTARDLARGDQPAARVVGGGLTAKVGLGLVVTLLLGAISAMRPAGIRLATFVLGLSAMAISVVDYVGHAFRGLQRIRLDAALLASMRVAIVLGGAWALWAGFGLTGLGLAYLAGATLAAAAGIAGLARLLPERPAIDVAAGRRLLQESLPLGGAILLSMAYVRTPLVLLDARLDAAAVGVYSVAQKLTEPLALIPAALMGSVFPAMAASHRPPGDRRRLGARSLALLAAVGTALAAAGVLGGRWLVGALYGGKYDAAAAPLRILALSLVLSFVNYVLTHAMMAAGRLRELLGFSAVLLAIAVGGGWLLVPRYGPTGAALTILAGETILLLLCRSALGSRGRGPLAPSGAGT